MEGDIVAMEGCGGCGDGVCPVSGIALS